VQVLEQRGGSALRDVAPRDGDPNGGLRFAERPASGLEAKPGVARLRSEPFGEIERDAVERAAELRAELPIPSRNTFDEWSGESDDLNCVFYDVWVEVSAHALPSAQLP
jgi:hypothetical protein